MISKGHHSAQSYRYNFFKIAIDVAIKEDGEKMANFAIGTRISKLEGNDFTRQIDSLRGTKVNHKDNIKRHGK